MKYIEQLLDNGQCRTMGPGRKGTSEVSPEMTRLEAWPPPGREEEARLQRSRRSGLKVWGCGWCGRVLERCDLQGAPEMCVRIPLSSCQTRGDSTGLDRKLPGHGTEGFSGRS